tara:strand:+ start:10793 stop:11308 length:516 start_codon:yes stop_codon:yes gene_type:complete
MNKKSRKVAILDRDGVLNENRGYVGHLDKFKWIKGAKSAIKFLKKENFYVAVITNQSGIARNYFKVKDVKNLHNFMQNDLKKINTKIDVFYFSPYHIDGVIQRYKKKSSCRKPGIGMFKKLQEKIAINKKKSFMIGDKKTDMIFAKKCGVKGFFFRKGNLFNFVKKNIIND